MYRTATRRLERFVHDVAKYLVALYKGGHGDVVIDVLVRESYPFSHCLAPDILRCLSFNYDFAIAHYIIHSICNREAYVFSVISTALYSPYRDSKKPRFVILDTGFLLLRMPIFVSFWDLFMYDASVSDETKKDFVAESVAVMPDVIHAMMHSQKYYKLCHETLRLCDGSGCSMQITGGAL
jgi:hypothetical protein